MFCDAMLKLLLLSDFSAVNLKILDLITIKDNFFKILHVEPL